MTSYCFVQGVNQDNEIAAGALILTPRDLYGFDVVRILERADYSASMAAKQKDLISKIEEARRMLRRTDCLQIVP